MKKTTVLLFLTTTVHGFSQNYTVKTTNILLAINPIYQFHLHLKSQIESTYLIPLFFNKKTVIRWFEKVKITN